MEPLFRIHDNARLILRWLLIIVPIAVAVGSVVAMFLWLLDLATATRTGQPWLLYLLPVAGLLIVFSYRAAGKNAEAGNNLILDEIHERGAGGRARGRRGWAQAARRSHDRRDSARKGRRGGRGY